MAFRIPVGNSVYSIYDPIGSRLIDRLSLGFSHLREHNSRHSFTNTVNPLCSCALGTKNVEHFFLPCLNKLSVCTTLKNELNNICHTINFLNSVDFIRAILYEDKHFDNFSLAVHEGTIRTCFSVVLSYY